MSDAKSLSELSMAEILGKIRRLLAEDDEAAGRSAAERHTDDDVLELTAAIDDDGTVRHLAPRVASPEGPADKHEPVAAGRTAAAPEAPREAPPRQAELEAAEPRLIPEPLPTAAVGRAASERREPRLDGLRPPAARTLEEIVCDLLRPMLQTWLDENLPPLVERLARAEIGRIAGKSEAA